MTDLGLTQYPDGRPAADAHDPSASEAYVPRLARDERDMRIVEWLVAGVALLASLFLSLPK